MSDRTQRVVILGAAGRDFHDFNVYWKDAPGIEIVAFTAAQIPDIAGRIYPPSLAGPRYPDGIPIRAEEDLESIIRDHDVTQVALAYSDLSSRRVMELAARVNAAGADFTTLAPTRTMLPSSKPVISVCAVRTGCGKSQTARHIARVLTDQGHRVGVVRHPMPYGDLEQQICQRFGSYDDLETHHCTIEEREEYEPHIDLGHVVFAGVDYAAILAACSAEADVVLWDGGNNDLPFYRPDLHIVVTDPHRCGHELDYYPGATNLRMADVVLINKVDTAPPEAVAALRRNIVSANPRARILLTDSPVVLSDPDAVAGRDVLVVEDGPTVTHGEMAFGAGAVAARRHGAARLVDPRPYAVGSLRGVFERYGHLRDVLPAMGYGAQQVSELEQTIRAIPCDVVVAGTPIDFARIVDVDKPIIRARYNLREHEPGALSKIVAEALKMHVCA